MEAYIKYVGEIKSNYTRWGKKIPLTEEKVDLAKYFSCSEERAEFIAKKLVADENVKIQIVKPAGETGRKKAQEIEKSGDKMLSKSKLTNKIQKDPKFSQGRK